MEKTESLIEQLLHEYGIEAKEVEIELSQDNDNFTFVIKGKANLDDFKEYLDGLNDDLFQEACERFEDETGITLNDFAHNINPDLFKQVVSQICQEKVNNLSKFILQ